MACTKDQRKGFLRGAESLISPSHHVDLMLPPCRAPQPPPAKNKKLVEAVSARLPEANQCEAGKQENKQEMPAQGANIVDCRPRPGTYSSSTQDPTKALSAFASFDLSAAPEQNLLPTAVLPALLFTAVLCTSPCHQSRKGLSLIGPDLSCRMARSGRKETLEGR